MSALLSVSVPVPSELVTDAPAPIKTLAPSALALDPFVRSVREPLPISPFLVAVTCILSKRVSVPEVVNPSVTVVANTPRELGVPNQALKNMLPRKFVQLL